MQQNLLQQQKVRHDNLMTQLDDAEERIEAYENTITEKKEKTVRGSACFT